MPLPHNLFDYCSIRKSNFIEKYLVVKRKISFVYKADILLTKLIIRGVTIGVPLYIAISCVMMMFHHLIPTVVMAGIWLAVSYFDMPNIFLIRAC